MPTSNKGPEGEDSANANNLCSLSPVRSEGNLAIALFPLCRYNRTWSRDKLNIPGIYDRGVRSLCDTHFIALRKRSAGGGEFQPREGRLRRSNGRNTQSFGGRIG